MKSRLLALPLILVMLLSAIPANSQDLVPVADLAGGSSVFVFRNSARSAPKRVIIKTRVVRTKTQRVETARKVSRQYVTLAKVAPRRNRSETVNENDPRVPKIQTMPREEASVIFAGVGEFFMERDDFVRATDYFREATQLDNKNLKAQAGLSEALALDGNMMLVGGAAKYGANYLTTARQRFDEALKYNNKNSPAYFGLAEIFSEENKEPEAIANYEKALSLDKDLTEIYVPLGILYYQRGEIAKAEELLTKAIAISPEDAQTQYFLGLIRYSQNRNEDALVAFTKAKTLDANYAEAFYQSGETLARLKRHREAIDDFTKATTLKNNYFDAYLGLGSAYFESSDYPQAIVAYKQAERLKNDNIEVLINLADTYREVANWNEAESKYNLATVFIERDKNYSRDEAAEIYSKIAFVIAKQCEENMKRAAPCRWDVAVRNLEKASTITDNNVDMANLGWAYYNAAKNDIANKRPVEARAKLEKAKAALEKAAFSSPKYIEGPLLNLGMTLTDLGDYAGAVEAFKRVIDKRPTWVFAMNELGIAYRKQDKFPEASAAFRKAVSVDGKYVIAYYNLAEAEFRAGNLGEAQKAYNKVKDLGRKDLIAQLQLISGGKLRG
ncbi:MAG TPA: tetratricopeptide repeat protein [Pyrinomonadaceae bacterium]|nr:tetratricopeptide repeat protein [Pyrinomonadaceae bacterium]